jgi:hypothetical protein
MHFVETIRTHLATLPVGQTWLAPLATLVVAFLARLVLRGGPGAAGPALAMLAGLVVLVGPERALHQALAPHQADSVLLLPAIGGVVAAFAPGLTPLLALAGSWWLLGAPASVHAIAEHILPLALVAAAIWAALRGMERADKLRRVLASLTLVCSAVVAGIGAPWPVLAGIPAAASLAGMAFGGESAGRGAAPGGEGGAPAGMLLGGIACLLSLHLGSLPHGGIAAADLAAAAPLFVLFPAGPLARMDPRVGAVLGLVLGVGATYLVRRLASF